VLCNYKLQPAASFSGFKNQCAARTMVWVWHAWSMKSRWRIVDWSLENISRLLIVVSKITFFYDRTKLWYLKKFNDHLTHYFNKALIFDKSNFGLETFVIFEWYVMYSIKAKVTKNWWKERPVFFVFSDNKNKFILTDKLRDHIGLNRSSQPLSRTYQYTIWLTILHQLSR